MKSEIKYDFGKLNLFDSNNQYIYFASLDENIKFNVKEENDVKLIKNNKLYSIKVNIPPKTKDEIENFKKEGYIDLYFNKSIERSIHYNITFRTETISINLICDKYKMKQEDKSSLVLCSSTPLINI